MLVENAEQLFLAFCFLALGTLVLLARGLGQGGKDLFWFGCFLCLSGVSSIHSGLSVWIYQDSPLPQMVFITLLLRVLTDGVAFSMFLWAVFGFQRRWPFYGMGLLYFGAALIMEGNFAATERASWLELVKLNGWLFVPCVAGNIGVGLMRLVGPWSHGLAAGTRGVAAALTLAFVGITGTTLGLVPSSFKVGAFPVGTEDVLMLAVVVTMVVLLLRRAWHAARQTEELESDFSAARRVQTALLGAGTADSRHFAFETVFETAKQVGGDFYWFSTPAENGSLIVVVGDVSGKGLKAAMMVSVAIGILGICKSNSPAAILATLNDGLAGRTQGFITCCCARFDVDGKVSVANAGHPQPYCDGRELELDAGLPLGVVSGVEYDETVVQGKRFTFVSDGVIEAADAKGELFGFERTLNISRKSAQEIGGAAKRWGQNDDITVVTVAARA